MIYSFLYFLYKNTELTGIRLTELAGEGYAVLIRKECIGGIGQDAALPAPGRYPLRAAAVQLSVCKFPSLMQEMFGLSCQVEGMV